MAIKNVVVRDDDPARVYVDFSWYADQAAGEVLDAEVLIDASTLSFNGADNNDPVDELRIVECYANIHLHNNSQTFSTGDNLQSVFIMDSNNRPLLAFDAYSNQKYCSFFDAADFLMSKKYSNNANGDLKIGIGRFINVTNGDAGSAASGPDQGSFVRLRLTCEKYA